MKAKNSKYLQAAFNEITKKPYSYLLIDLHPTTSDEIRFRTNIFPDEFPMKAILPKKFDDK